MLSFFRHRIIASIIPRVAPDYSFEAQPKSLPNAKPFHSFIGIVTATGMKAANATAKQARRQAVIQG